MLQVGNKAPAWKGLTQDATEVSSETYVGHWLLLYFYPKDETSGCTTEACAFRDAFDRLKNRIAIVGVSGDDVASHKKFAEHHQLPFTLVADPQKDIITLFGTEGTIYPKRTTFLIDPAGIIQKIYHGFIEQDHAADVEKDLDALGV